MTAENLKKIVLFADRPISNEQDDKFGHHVFVNTLVSAIKAALLLHDSVNVGLFGKWGTGKSTIIELFSRKVRDEQDLNSKVQVVTFNVWKNSFDSLRRQFLLFLDGEDGLNANLNIRGHLDTTVSTSTSFTKIDWKNASIAVGLGIIVFLLLLNFSKGDIATNSILSLLILILVYFFEEFRRGIVKEESSNKTTHRLDQADQFEHKFKDIMAAFRKKAKGKKLIIVFDDLDRCTEQVIFETLTMVKTFLGEQDCLYVIPCDDERIKDHLVGKMGYSTENADEFLRKFFQVSLRIPPFGEEDIFSYTHELAEKAGFPKEIEKVIASAFAETPRHVKQFLNNLSIIFNIALEREELRNGKAGSLRKGLVTSNPALLAKIEAIRTRWPGAFNEMLIDESMLAIFEGIITGRVSHQSAEKGEKAEKLLKECEGLKKFLFATIDVKKGQELSAFIKLSQPFYSSSLSDCGEFLIRALTGDIEFTKSKLVDPEREREYLDALLNVINKKVNTGYPDQAFSALNILVETFPELRKSIQEHAQPVIVSTLNRAEIKPRVWVMTMAKLFQVLSSNPDEFEKELIRYITRPVGNLSQSPPTLITQREILEELLKLWSTLAPGLDNVYETVRGNIAQLYDNQPDKANVFIEAISDSQNVDAQRALFSQDLFPKLVKTISNGSTPSDIAVKELIAKLRHITSDENRLVALNKCIELITAINLNSINGQWRFALDLLTSFDPPQSLSPIEGNFIAAINSMTARLASPTEKLEVIQVFFRYAGGLQKSAMDSFSKTLPAYINSYDADFCRRLLETFKHSEIQIPENVWATLRPRTIALGDQELIGILFKHYISFGQQEEAKTYFSEVLNSNTSLGTTLFLNNAGDIAQELVGNITEVLIQKSRSFSPNQFSSVFDPIVHVMDFCSQEYRDVFGNRLLELIHDFEQGQSGAQEVAIEYLIKLRHIISRPKKQYIASQLISKARTHPIAPTMNLPPIKSILRGIISLQEDLPEDGKEDLIDYLLPLIVTPSLPETFKIAGAELLSQLQFIPSSRKDQALQGLYDAFKLAPQSEWRETLRKCLLHFKENHKDWVGWKGAEGIGG